MNSKSYTEIWNKLSSKNLVYGQMPPFKNDTPWFVKFFQSFSGWLAAVLLLIVIVWGAVLITNISPEKMSGFFLILGLGLNTLAYISFKKEQSGFLENFILALSIAGVALVVFSINYLISDGGRFFFDLRVVSIFTIIYQAILIWKIENYAHRVLSSFILAIAFSYLFLSFKELFFPEIALTFAVVWLWINEFNFENSKAIEAIAYGFTAALVYTKFTSVTFIHMGLLYLDKLKDNAIWFKPEISAIFTVGIFIYLIWSILKENRVEVDNKIVILLALLTAFLVPLALEVHGLVLALIILFLGYAHKNSMLIFLGVVLIISFFSIYYYYLGETLMDKALVLLIMGVGFLLFRFLSTTNILSSTFNEKKEVR